MADESLLEITALAKSGTRWSLPPVDLEDVDFENFGPGEVGNLDINEEMSEEATNVAFAWVIDKSSISSFLATTAGSDALTWTCDGEGEAKVQRYNDVYLKNTKLRSEEVKRACETIYC
jgi:hypothetical protein